MEVLAPVSGSVVPLSEVPDEVFSGGMAGEGAAIVPDEGGEVVAPVSGRLTKLFEGGHAFGLLADCGSGGMELIVHLGLDTIELAGKGFEKLAAEGDVVEAGRPIVCMDLQTIRSTGYDPITPVVVANADEFRVSGVKRKRVKTGEVMFEAGG
ncbi:PTS sugar transporter subunit IIA [Rubrobacter aplysinae]|uniref:PTS sugar transporter subunit IIA n=1 Tax=Rubrobacter aplysinae TaxID=909625 RepID=UPI00069F0E55|nr:PTS glucose transporter subunit IIA [Rubrobacter aplysinae]